MNSDELVILASVRKHRVNFKGKPGVLNQKYSFSKIFTKFVPKMIKEKNIKINIENSFHSH